MTTSASTEAAGQLTSFYGEMTSVERVLAALRRRDVALEPLRASDLYERDLDCQNLGAFEMLSAITAAVSRRAAPTATDHLLDVGCGMGGPGRFLADRFGCTITGIDLLALRVDTAEELTKRAGLASRISYRVADVTSLPFEDAGFAQAWMLDVGVHVQDKHAMFSEIARVLEPGGLLVMHDQMGPLTRAMRPLTEMAPFIAPTLPQMIRTVESAGLRVLDWQDTTPQIVSYFERIRAEHGPLTPGPEEDAKPWRRWLRITTDAYARAPGELGSRTGLLLAERR
jgi:ubiquinone/menaquinone biosynthesis C-methylase UbiE